MIFFLKLLQSKVFFKRNLIFKETLEFAAAMKCSPNEEIRAQKVQEMLSELELTQIKDYRVGAGASPALSRGEKKRLSIAVELITNPALVFMDEPTTSMDTFTAEKIIEIIGKLAQKGRTIIATIHQPNTDIYNKLDQLMLLSYGNVVYSVFLYKIINKKGDASKAIEYFKSINEPCPANKNPAEFLMTMMIEEKEGTSKEERVKYFIDKYNEHPDLSSIFPKYTNQRKLFEKCGRFNRF